MAEGAAEASLPAKTLQSCTDGSIWPLKFLIAWWRVGPQGSALFR